MAMRSIFSDMRTQTGVNNFVQLSVVSRDFAFEWCMNTFEISIT